MGDREQVTTDDELFHEDVYPEVASSAAAKEVQRYRQALRVGFDRVSATGLLTLNHILEVQAALEQNSAGFRKLPGTELKNPGTGETVYVPPQDPDEVVRLMGDLEHFINENDRFDADALVKMALIHHQFESIHPRTGEVRSAGPDNIASAGSSTPTTTKRASSSATTTSSARTTPTAP